MSARKAAGKGAVVAAACMGCCAPPIIGALGLTAGLAAAAGVFLGLAAVITVLLAGVGWIVNRRVRERQPELTTVPVPLPTRREPVS